MFYYLLYFISFNHSCYIQLFNFQQFLLLLCLFITNLTLLSVIVNIKLF